jgi:urea transporter
MQRTVLIFRALLAGGLFLAIVGTIVDVSIPNLLPKVLDDAWATYSENTSWSRIAIVGGLGLIVFAAGVIATIGLMLLKRWARPLALWITVISVLAYPALGGAVYSGWALMLDESATIMWGAALAMAYFSELKSHFQG